MAALIWDHQSVWDGVRALAAQYPALQVTVLTRSILGREIPVITLGRGKRAVLYVGAHRGTDHITSGVLMAFLKDYCYQHQKNATVFEYAMSYLLEERKIYVIPMLNPDGVEYVIHGVAESNPLYARVHKLCPDGDFSKWRANARGVDLHHNYDAGFFAFQNGEKHQEIGARYHGEFPESEPETAALASFLRFHREEIRGVLALNTAGEAILCSCRDHLTAKTMAVGRVLSHMTGYRLERPEGVLASGSLSDWCIQKMGRPAFTLQCGKSDKTEDPKQLELIYERLRRILFSFSCIV